MVSVQNSTWSEVVRGKGKGKGKPGSRPAGRKIGVNVGSRTGDDTIPNSPTNILARLDYVGGPNLVCFGRTCFKPNFPSKMLGDFGAGKNLAVNLNQPC